MSILPTAAGLACIFIISLQASRNLFEVVMKDITNLIAIFQRRAVANRLSNDLKFFDKNFCLCLYDITSTGCAVLASVGLCLVGLGFKNYLWMLGTLAILSLIAISMYLLNQRSMWALRECLRFEGGLRSLMISTLYDHSRYSGLLQYFAQQNMAQDYYIGLVNRIVNVHLNVTSIECWFGVRLLFLSLAGCSVICGVCFLLKLSP